eukprot:6189224-Pleurochrysis_carterae.AAC.2
MNVATRSRSQTPATKDITYALTFKTDSCARTSMFSCPRLYGTTLTLPGGQGGLRRAVLQDPTLPEALQVWKALVENWESNIVRLVSFARAGDVPGRSMARETQPATPEVVTVPGRQHALFCALETARCRCQTLRSLLSVQSSRARSALTAVRDAVGRVLASDGVIMGEGLAIMHQPVRAVDADGLDLGE